METSVTAVTLTRIMNDCVPNKFEACAIISLEVTYIGKRALQIKIKLNLLTAINYWQVCIQNPLKNLRWTFLRKCLTPKGC